MYVAVSCDYDGYVFGVFMLLMFKCLVQPVDTTVEITSKVGSSEIMNHVGDDLKDEKEQYHEMVMETTEKIMGNLGAADIDSRLKEQLIHGILYAFQEQTTEVM
jgi:splicing factor 3B subunit 1